jgi:hypothetical protein
MLFLVYMNNSTSKNVAISIEVHKILVDYAQSVDGKITKIAERAIREYVDKKKKIKTGV